MKNYKEYSKVHLGCRDYAALVLVGCKEKGLTSEILEYHEDGDYYAYLVDKDAIIGSHYTKVSTFKSWLKVYDDVDLMQEFNGEEINVFRAGNFGCIIQIVQ